MIQNFLLPSLVFLLFLYVVKTTEHRKIFFFFLKTALNKLSFLI